MFATAGQRRALLWQAGRLRDLCRRHVTEPAKALTQPVGQPLQRGADAGVTRRCAIGHTGPVQARTVFDDGR
ncbi:hypothetical protein [Ponticoccus litoralis]|uniref:Uncharacterized protein n=1 Tax=Ponticoccus litoralis TaxID=422297 RepID=A0AAW9SCX6_9RHOB